MAARSVAVTNTTPVILLTGVGELRLLDALFDRLVVPLAVWRELVDKADAPEPGAVLELDNVAVLPTPSPPPEAMRLDAGERAAIAYGTLHPGTWVLLDERNARRIGKELGLEVHGTLGVLLEAKRRGLIEAVRPLVQRLRDNGCWLDDRLVAAVLAAADEK